MTPVSPLAGVRVLDASRVLAGPFCGQILGDLGAEVIKIERPGEGDETRGWGPPFTESGLSAYFLSCNRNKQSVAIDLAHPEGVELFHALAGRCDVLLENFRADSLPRLGATPAELLRINPRLIVCSISGFGREGPWRDVPGYDFAIQALSGLMSITGQPDGPPSKVGVAMTDVLTGLYAATAILACLHARQTSGRGYAIDLALLDCAIASQVNLAQAYLSSGTVPPRQGNAHLQIVPYQLFQTSDGWLVLAVGNDGQWQRFCTAADLVDLGKDARWATNTQRVLHRLELVPLLESALRRRSTADWRTALLRGNVPHAPVWNYQTLFESEIARDRALQMHITDAAGNGVNLLASPFRIDGNRPPVPRMPPQLGEHTRTVLESLLGLEESQIESLKAGNVIAW